MVTSFLAVDMRATKKLTVGAIMTALGVVLMALGAYVEVLDFTVMVIASLIMIFVDVEIGSPYTWLTWAATSLLGALFFTVRPVWILYLFIFGFYPILKGYIEKMKRGARIPLKLVLFSVLFMPVVLLTQLITGVPFFAVGELNLPGWVDSRVVTALLYAVCILGMFLYDAVLNTMIRFYFLRLRHRFARFLK